MVSAKSKSGPLTRSDTSASTASRSMWAALSAQVHLAREFVEEPRVDLLDRIDQRHHRRERIAAEHLPDALTDQRPLDQRATRKRPVQVRSPDHSRATRWPTPAWMSRTVAVPDCHK